MLHVKRCQPCGLGAPEEDLLREKDCGSEVLSKSESDWYRVVPVHESRVYEQNVRTPEWSAWCVECVKRVVNQFAQFAEALVHRPDVRRLLAELL